MKIESMVASAAINFGLAFVVLSLFSILKKQPSNAPIYYARRLARGHPVMPLIRCDGGGVSHLSRFLPSVTWIPRAFRVTEDEVLHVNGLDALIVIRLFKFGMHFFAVCAVVGFVVLLPVNYDDQDHNKDRVSHSMEYFSIANIRGGSNRLWVHFTCLWFISIYGLYLLRKEYTQILHKRVEQLRRLRHRPEQFTVLVRQVPFCSEHRAHGCSVDHFFSKYHSHIYHSCQVMYDGKDVENLLDQAKYITRKIEKLRERCSAKKHERECSLSLPFRDHVRELTQHEEKLQDLVHRIHHLQGLLKQKELPVAFATFKSRYGASLVAQSQQHSHPLMWITEMAPEPRDVSWRSLAVPVRLLPLYQVVVIVLATLLTIFFAVPVTAVQGIAKYEKLKKWFPPAMAFELIPGVRSILTGYLPSAILRVFIYIVPFAILGMAKFGGNVSKSKEEIKACNMVFYFLVGNVFFLSLISGSLLDEIGEYFAHPKDFPSHLASLVTAQADFFTTYILTDGLSGFSLEILQPGFLLWDLLKSCTCGTETDENPYLYSLPYFRVLPTVALSVLIGMVYAVVSPLLLPFLVGYFCLGYVVYVNQIEDVYETIYETCGQFWPHVYHYIFVGIVLMQITMIGLFVLKSKPAAAIATIPLLLLTLVFNHYCNIRFLPTFRKYPIQDASEHDGLDQRSGQLEVNYENASNAYRQPNLRSMSVSATESSITEPLVSLL